MIEHTLVPVDLGDIVYQISVKRRGSTDRAVVFIHGWGCAKECFDAAFDDHALQRYGIVTFDLLGYGQSDKPVGFDYSLENHAALTIKLISQLQLRDVVLVGHSMGGAVAVLAAAALGDCLRMLVSVEGNLAADDVGKAESTVRKVAAQSFVNFESDGFTQFKAGLVRSTDRGMQEWSKWCGQASAEAFHKDCRSLVEWSDNGQLLKAFTASPRRAYIVGAQSRNKAETMAAIGPTAIIEIPMGKHFMMLDNPADFYGAVACLV